MFKQSQFIAALQFVTHTMAKNDIRRYLNGVHVTFPDSVTCQLEACNGHCAARITIATEAEHGLSTETGFIIERDSVLAVIAAFKGKSDAQLTVTQEDGALLFANGAASVRAALIDARYPDTAQIWPRTEPTGAPSLPVDPGQLATAAKAAKPLQNPRLGLQLDTWDAASCLRLRVQLAAEFDTLSNATALLMPMRY